MIPLHIGIQPTCATPDLREIGTRGPVGSHEIPDPRSYSASVSSNRSPFAPSTTPGSFLIRVRTQLSHNW